MIKTGKVNHKNSVFNGNSIILIINNPCMPRSLKLNGFMDLFPLKEICFTNLLSMYFFITDRKHMRSLIFKNTFI